MAKVINIKLSSEEVGRAIKEVAEFKQDLMLNTKKLQYRVAKMLSERAQQGFNNSTVDDLITGEGRTPDVSVSVSHQGNITLVIANGADAVFVEFGAGVYNNGSAGSSPHPKGQQLGFTIGSYGKGNGAKKVWGFLQDGEVKFTHGTKATMPMQKALNEVCPKIYQIAREVFV